MVMGRVVKCWDVGMREGAMLRRAPTNSTVLSVTNSLPMQKSSNAYVIHIKNREPNN